MRNIYECGRRRWEYECECERVGGEKEECYERKTMWS